jgi:hypothetical protein
MSEERPKSIRVRCDGENEHRFDAIADAGDALEATSNTQAVVDSCAFTARMLGPHGRRGALQEALNVVAEECPPRVAREVAEALSTPQLDVEVETRVRFDRRD